MPGWWVVLTAPTLGGRGGLLGCGGSALLLPCTMLRGGGCLDRRVRQDSHVAEMILRS
ncbi:hypothetical protein LY78DRAFT_650236 [Colletotrichum sublineola]|nr:hypothetical protein LY78DRAFT_650236 [Colletotrichum sublineola]